MREEVPKEVVNEEGDKEDLTSSSPTGNMDGKPEVSMFSVWFKMTCFLSMPIYRVIIS